MLQFLLGLSLLVLCIGVWRNQYPAGSIEHGHSDLNGSNWECYVGETDADGKGPPPTSCCCGRFLARIGRGRLKKNIYIYIYFTLLRGREGHLPCTKDTNCGCVQATIAGTFRERRDRNVLLCNNAVCRRSPSTRCMVLPILSLVLTEHAA